MSFSKSSAFSVKRAWPSPDDAMPNLFLDLIGPLLDLSNEVSFVTEFYREGG